MNELQTLDPLTLPLFGERLIEASAGTGKTYTLAALYLRLLLGLGDAAAFPRTLSVEEILVVTFTEAATEELRGRIRDNIHMLRIACIRGESEQPLFHQLLQEIADPITAGHLLLAAERLMDEAAIYTIHGFCQRMLTYNAFESGILFEQTLIEDEQPIRKQAVADFWRRHCYPLSLSIARVVSHEWQNPDALLADLNPYLHGEMPDVKQNADLVDEKISTRHQQIIHQIAQIKQSWLESYHEFEALIVNSGADKRSYSSKNLPNWLNAVTVWAQQETEDYQLPKQLTNFSQSILCEKTKKGAVAEHPLFVEIDRLFAQPLTLRDLVIYHALIEVRQAVQQEKKQRAEMGFDDLLSRLDIALAGENKYKLAEAIRQRYPVAMIDEFQDTDPQQYRIFHTIYGGRQDTGLLLIGDPKQAIYAFRGADIFTYIRARNEVQSHYTMTTNWRSSPNMVAAVNRLFNQLNTPFIFAQIPFLTVNAAPANKNLAFTLAGKQQPAMQFWLLKTSGVSQTEYQQAIAQQCAQQIQLWLASGQCQQALLFEKQKSRPVSASDIVILVRTGLEASLMRDALSELNIPSVYLSNRDSVFRTLEARDILWLLKAVLTPADERAVRSSLASWLFGLDAQQIDELNQSEKQWDAIVAEFMQYQKHWKTRGVLPMLQNVLLKRQLAERILASEGGERRLTDILHIGELLQGVSLQAESEHALVRWLVLQINNPNDQAKNQQLRLESDRHLVQIVTIHKSKGLEYPLVWLPFISSYRLQKNALYHDRQSFKAVLDLQSDEDALVMAEEERLAEDLRLLYVAVTRAIYHCSIGIAPIFSGNRKREGDSDLHRSGIGYLMQKAQKADSETLVSLLNGFTDNDIALSTVAINEKLKWQPVEQIAGQLSAKKFTRELHNDWRITSYSGLQQHSSAEYFALLPHFDADAMGEKQAEHVDSFTSYTFPKGASAGTFLHALLEPLDFTQPIDVDRLKESAKSFALDDKWLPVLQTWLTNICGAKLNEQGVSLKDIPANHKQAELQFYLPISCLQADRFDAIVRRYDPLSQRCSPLIFERVSGMLKGFIDLVFFWQGRYWLLDYKSNWLGDEGINYHYDAMTSAICEHRYDLQYQLYSLALHRYLRHRLPDYDYEKHFGGVFYLFLRGMSVDKFQQGVFSCRPEYAMIDALDKLFIGNA